MKDIVVYQTVTRFGIRKDGELVTRETKGKKTLGQLEEMYGDIYSLAYGKRQWVMKAEKFKTHAYEKQFQVIERTNY